VASVASHPRRKKWVPDVEGVTMRFTVKPLEPVDL
jgi:hypothetical protein